MLAPERQQEVNELYALMQQHPSVKSVVNIVLAQEGLDIFEFAEQRSEIFEAVYDDCFSMVAELGVDEVGD